MEDGGSDSETMAHRTPALTTKSGRLIQAPNTFSPVVRTPQIVRRGRGRGGRLSSGLMRGAGYAGSFGSGSGSGKGGSRVPCKICTRSAGTMSNVLLNCAICHGGWHQFCHDPPVAEAFRTGGWLCGGCEAIKTTKGTGPNISTEAVRLHPCHLSHIIPTRLPGPNRAMLMTQLETRLPKKPKQRHPSQPPSPRLSNPQRHPTSQPTPSRRQPTNRHRHHNRRGASPPQHNSHLPHRRRQRPLR